MLLYDLRERICKEVVLNKNVKIYFNGLLIQRDDFTLGEYGMKEGSCLYVNTENVIGNSQYFYCITPLLIKIFFQF